MPPDTVTATMMATIDRYVGKKTAVSTRPTIHASRTPVAPPMAESVTASTRNC
jgi:hypothetical protein